ncbi:hypothetical protein BDN72DRAFT_892774 [Pluteus cervinus]|uniref:Uncharacterized protein n=1 Tax=Pluteus cervinus TaxID=181527 RepID=A0ACD3BA83_9AGAR|nr:hypothetical protein BDN72DRAFT_892774 [Pluteus cervinus]
MLPAQRNKIDLSKLSDQEKVLISKYGKLPTHKNVLMKMQKERKYFDSGDYALSKAGVAPQSNVGTAIPNPENIPHASASSSPGAHVLVGSPTNPTSPMNKESGLSQSQTTDVEMETESTEPEPEKAKEGEPEITTSTPAVVPILSAPVPPAPVEEKTVVDVEVEQVVVEQAQQPLTITTTTTETSTETAMETTPDSDAK